MYPIERNMIDLERAAEEYTRDIFFDLLFTLLTCGLWNLRVQYVQMEAVNWMLGRQKYNFFKWLIFSILTCGLYHFYHEFIKSKDIDLVRGIDNSNNPILHLVISIFAFSIIADALQQSEINNYFQGTKNQL